MGMSDLPSGLMHQQAYARPMSGEELELLGKAASALYSKSGTPLTQAVVEIVKHAGLGPEQVRRVAEFANVNAYLQEFQKCGNDHRYVQFNGGPADIPAILRDLNDGGGGTVFDRGIADYGHAPVDVAKLASRNMDRLGAEDQKLASMFQSKDQALPYADPLGDAYSTYTKLASARELVTHELGEAESLYAGVVNSIFETVKQAALEGVPLGHIVQAWSTVTDEPDFMKAAFAVLTPRLMDNQVFPSVEHLGESLEKMASGLTVDPSHPLVHDFRDFCELLDKMASLRVTREELTDGMDHLGTFLRGAIEKTSTVWSSATHAAASAAKPAAEIAGQLHPLVGKGVGAAVQYSPHLATLAGAIALKDHIENDPGRKWGVVRKGVALVPGTKSYDQRIQAMQYGQ